MAIARFGRQAKRPYGICVKMTAVALLGLCFIFVWSMFSSPSSTLTTQRESFDEIAEPVSANPRVSNSGTQSVENEPRKHDSSNEDKNVKVESDKDERKVNGSVSLSVNEHESMKKGKNEVENKKDNLKLNNGVVKENQEQEEEESEGEDKENEGEEGEVVDGKEDVLDGEGETNEETEGDDDLVEPVDQEAVEKVEDEAKNAGKKRKFKGPVFDPKAHYSWKLCSTRSKHNYIPCIDIETSGKLQSYRHTERSCPRMPPMCLVPLPHEGYGTPLHWPESKLKVYTGT